MRTCSSISHGPADKVGEEARAASQFYRTFPLLFSTISIISFVTTVRSIHKVGEDVASLDSQDRNQPLCQIRTSAIHGPMGF
jgi:hypothetical protein